VDEWRRIKRKKGVGVGEGGSGKLSGPSGVIEHQKSPGGENPKTYAHGEPGKEQGTMEI